jgi:hypothetical protein
MPEYPSRINYVVKAMLQGFTKILINSGNDAGRRAFQLEMAWVFKVDALHQRRRHGLKSAMPILGPWSQSRWFIWNISEGSWLG